MSSFLVLWTSVVLRIQHCLFINWILCWFSLYKSRQLRSYKILASRRTDNARAHSCFNYGFVVLTNHSCSRPTLHPLMFMIYSCCIWSIYSICPTLIILLSRTIFLCGSRVRCTILVVRIGWISYIGIIAWFHWFNFIQLRAL